MQHGSPWPKSHGESSRGRQRWSWVKGAMSHQLRTETSPGSNGSPWEVRQPQSRSGPREKAVGQSPAAPLAPVTRRGEKEASIEAQGASPGAPRPGSAPRDPRPALTVIAHRAPVGSHGAVTGEAIPLLQADALVGTRLFGAGGAGAWEKQEEEHTLSATPRPAREARQLQGQAGSRSQSSRLKGPVLTRGGRGNGGLKDCQAWP